jgi:hypothetical protein
VARCCEHRDESESFIKQDVEEWSDWLNRIFKSISVVRSRLRARMIAVKVRIKWLSGSVY